MFLLPTIFIGAFLEMARTASEDIALPLGARPKQQANVATLEAQVDDLKHTIALLNKQLADMHKQHEKWQSSAERVSLTASY